jgi:hypothetical protein
VINTEDQLRELFEQIDAPDLPPPGFEQLRGRARRRRRDQVTSVLGCLALISAAAVGAVALSRASRTVRPIVPVTAVRVHLEHGHERQWLIATQTVASRRFQAATYFDKGAVCIVATHAVGWCQPARTTATVAEYEANQTNYPSITEILGQVPVNARTVTVHIDDISTTVRAVRTPSSRRHRFFAAFLRVPHRYRNGLPIVGVYDAAGHAVANPGSPPASDVVRATTAAHAVGFPGHQHLLGVSGSRAQEIVYPIGGHSLCVAAAVNNDLYGLPGCTSTRPTAARILADSALPDGRHVLIGDAPRWAASLFIAGPTSAGQLTLESVTGFGDRLFWIDLLGPGVGPGNVIATCTAGDNCSVVRPLRLPSG